MSRQTLVKVIKRSHREQPGDAAVESWRTEISVREERRELAATVTEWVSEFRQARLARHQEIKEQLGWLQGGS